MNRFMMTSTAALLAGLAAPAWAQDTTPAAATPPAAAAPAPGVAPPADTAGTSTGEIVVTAQKRSERLQEVPLAVSVLNGAALSSLGKSSLEGAVNLVPSLNFQKSGTTLNQSLFLRGIGTATFSIAGEPSVSTVVDGVVYSRPGEAFGDLVDIDRLEVLRGPQGTLFGKNASAGVINIVTQQPTHEFGGYAEGSFFTKSEVRVRGAVNLPVSDTLLTRFTGFYGHYNGNIDNEAVGHEVNGYKHYGGRAQVTWEPSSKAKLAFIADYHKDNDDCCAEVIGTTALNAAGQPIASAVTAALPTPKGDESRTINQNFVTRTKETGYGFSLQGDFELGTQTVTSITAYRDYKNTEIRDGDFLAQPYAGFNQLHDVGPQVGHTFSQEIRLTSPVHQFISYVVGVYYSRAYSERIFTRNDIACNAIVASGHAGAVRQRQRDALDLPQRHRRLRLDLQEPRLLRAGHDEHLGPLPLHRRRALHHRPARRVRQPQDRACRPRDQRQFRPGRVRRLCPPRRRRRHRQHRADAGARLLERRAVARQDDQRQLVGQGRAAV